VAGEGQPYRQPLARGNAYRRDGIVALARPQDDARAVVTFRLGSVSTRGSLHRVSDSLPVKVTSWQRAAICL